VVLNDIQGSHVKPTMWGHQGQDARDQMPGSSTPHIDDGNDAKSMRRPYRHLGGGGSRDCHRSLEV